ncbi:CysH, 3'-phosphoadenosine 5'-phosphosulfate sulfotransferase (PAPS reductase)-FAD synthetase [Pyrenophora tritici-repentis]|uniref:CysH, 3'-phosphoadenosine 5'-phosphosulfate sulfotransferase (PAPS reductase)-FAD synthetase n=1 Tax=Pyrenophora tritici-repentis TaxID=45151 RepID=A0A316ZK55_9PLEO|nr:CysH, 3'-phosphoadenosine 5'-phosphosulfate sulfotransferase (PAPS reductase)-FAD synthetase [Pyrenophora tritici-repentis]
MSSPMFSAVDSYKQPTMREESGYASAASSQESLTEVYFTKPHLKFINSQLQKLEPQDILRWCITSLPGLFQTSLWSYWTRHRRYAFEARRTSEAQHDLIFLDTLYHFDETYALVDRIRRRYGTPVHVYKPAGCDSVNDFTTRHGDKLWETNDELYDYVAKVEPAERAYSELQVKAVLTGRRRSQGGKRGDLDIVEVDEAGLIKINPLANWSFTQVKEYVDANDVPYNELLNRGYKSVGDWHSTQPVAAGEDERSGRWKGKNKTECGIHNPKSRYAQFLQEQK